MVPQPILSSVAPKAAQPPAAGAANAAFALMLALPAAAKPGAPARATATPGERPQPLRRAAKSPPVTGPVALPDLPLPPFPPTPKPGPAGAASSPPATPPTKPAATTGAAKQGEIAPASLDAAAVANPDPIAVSPPVAAAAAPPVASAAIPGVAPAGVAPPPAPPPQAPPPNAAATPSYAAPAKQIGHAVALQLAPDTGKLTIQLHPATLGSVEIHIERPHGAAAIVNLFVEKPETLHALQQDLPRLHQALDRAGIPTESPASIQLAPVAASGSAADPGLGQPGGQLGGQPHDASRNPPGGQPQSRAAPGSPEPQGADDTAEPGRMWRLGVNITA